MSNSKEGEPEFYPLATNILKLQYYSDFFDLTEIVMFDYFIVKAKAFKYKPFFHSRKTISKEVRIKEDRLTTIIKRFEVLGIIEKEIKGYPKIHYFTVDFNRIVELLPQIFQFTENSKLSPENSKLYAFFSKLLAESSTQKKYNKKANKEGKKEEIRIEKEMNMVVDESTTNVFFSFSDESKGSTNGSNNKPSDAAARKAQREAEAEEREKARQTDSLKRLLNKTYANRVELYNSEKKKGQRVKSIVKLGFLKRNEETLYELGKIYDYDQIENSFTAFVDEFLEGDSGVTKLVPYFLSRKPVTKDFDTFNTYLNKFISSYSHTK